MKQKLGNTLGAACLAFLLAMVGATGAATAQSKIYWTDTKTNTIERANLDGSNAETIVNGVTLSFGVAVDQTNGKIYWVDIGQFADPGFGDEVIRRANLNGTEVKTILTTADGLRHPWDIQVDPIGGKIYWADGTTQKIYRADLDGKNSEVIIDIPSFRATDYGVGDTAADRNLEFTSVGGIAIDVLNNDLYWTDYFGADIHRASMDGTQDSAAIEQLVVGLSTPRGIAVDGADGRMYWTHNGVENEIMRAFTDGFGVEALVNKDLGTRLKMPFRIGLDTVARQVYWADRDSGLIQRANFDGSGVTTILTLEYEKKPGDFRSSSPSGLALYLTGDTAPGDTPADSTPPPTDTTPPSDGGDSGVPDLTGSIDKLRWDEKNGSEQLEFEYTVENIGTAPVAGSYTIQAFLSTDAIHDGADTLIESWTGQGLGTGAQESHKSKLDLSGSHANEYLLIVIDIGNTIAESDESNNVLVEQIVP